MRKILCIAFALLFALSAVSITAVADSKTAVLSFAVNTDAAGLTAADLEKTVDLTGGDLLLVKEASFICNCNNEMIEGAVEAGRTYYFNYMFNIAADCAWPAEAEDIAFTCSDKGELCYVQFVTASLGESQSENSILLNVVVKVRADGSFFQNIMGFFADLIAKVQAWSLY